MGSPWLTRPSRGRLIQDTDMEGGCVGEAAAADFPVSSRRRDEQPGLGLTSSSLAGSGLVPGAQARARR
jgi:hypothetical protein